VIVADTSGLLALYNEREPEHGRVAEVVRAQDEPLVVSPYVVAELDYLVATRLGVEAELAVLRELAGGAYDLPHAETHAAPAAVPIALVSAAVTFAILLQLASGVALYWASSTGVGILQNALVHRYRPAAR
jgi:predicted nucleic acid-binding protein